MLASISFGACGVDDADFDDLNVEESAIFGGTTGNSSNYPWVVDICAAVGNTYRTAAQCVALTTRCQGVLISPTWVLSSTTCVAPLSHQTVAFKRGSGASDIDARFVAATTMPVEGDLILLHLSSAFTHPSVKPADLPISVTSPGTAGVVAVGYPTATTMRVSTPSYIATDPSQSDKFTAKSTTSSLCTATDRGAGFIVQAGGVNFVRGIVTSTLGSCNANNAVWTGTLVRSHLSWIRSTIGAAAPGGYKAAPADYDGDGKVDIAVKYDSGDWRIDLAANGFSQNVWDWSYPGYGDSTATPVPADYDGDGKADLAIKTTNGEWFINYSADGLATGFNAFFYGYGFSDAIPVPADYDGDTKADLSIKGSGGGWGIDYASDGFGAWNVMVTGYGNAGAIPVPGDYDGDLKADLAIKDSGGGFYIDAAGDGFGAWNMIASGYGNSTYRPVAADFDGDHLTDISVLDTAGTWFFDYAGNGWAVWNNWRTGYYTSGQLLPADYDHDTLADPAMLLGNSWSIDYGSTPGNVFDVTRTITYD